jgi:hypothetical protein
MYFFPVTFFFAISYYTNVKLTIGYAPTGTVFDKGLSILLLILGLNLSPANDVFKVGDGNRFCKCECSQDTVSFPTSLSILIIALAIVTLAVFTLHATSALTLACQDSTIGPSGLRELYETKCPLFTVFFLSSLAPCYFSPRRGYRRVSKFRVTQFIQIKYYFFKSCPRVLKHWI